MSRAFRSQQRSIALSTPVHASFLGPLSPVAESAAVVAAIGGLTLSALPLLTGEARERNANRPENEDAEDENFTWTVMGFVSFLPYANFTAWLFKALNDDDPAYYYGLAFLYSLPSVLHDLRFDSYTTFFLLLGALHVQVERIAATEPVQLDWPGASQLAAALKGLARPATEFSESARRKRISAGPLRQSLPVQEADAGESPSAEQLEQQELERWDKMLRDRQNTRND